MGFVATAVAPVPTPADAPPVVDAPVGDPAAPPEVAVPVPPVRLALPRVGKGSGRLKGVLAQPFAALVPLPSAPPVVPPPGAAQALAGEPSGEPPADGELPPIGLPPVIPAPG